MVDFTSILVMFGEMVSMEALLQGNHSSLIFSKH